MQKSKSYFFAALLLALLSALLGGLTGAVSAGFLHLLEAAQTWLWQVSTAHLPLQALLLCMLGGLLVGLCQRYLGDHPKGIQEALGEIRHTGRLEYRHLPQGLVTAFLSLVFGASLGPEAAIVDLVGGLGTWAGDMLRAARQRLGLPAFGQGQPRWKQWLQRWPSLTALAAGVLAFGSLLNGLYGGGFLNPSQPFQVSDLLWSIPLSLLGAGAGWLYLNLQQRMRSWLAPLQPRPVLRSLAGGVALGLSALFLPMVLFSGQHAMQQAYDQALALGFWTLFFTSLARLVLTSLLLATGWKGGQFLPLLFAGAALGLSVSIVFPAVPAAAAALSVMASLLAVVLPKPGIALVLMVLMFPWQYAGISIMAVGAIIFGRRIGQQMNRPTALPALDTEPTQ